MLKGGRAVPSMWPLEIVVVLVGLVGVALVGLYLADRWHLPPPQK